jgi:geranylgeranyl diphosphate synthase type II
MNSETWWKRRAACAHSVLTQTYQQGMGSMDRVDPRLGAALSDILANPGSMVRAVSAYLVGIETGLAEDAARALACGIEYLHSASLVFDDLPAMDDARTRRGAACPHIVHGEAIAMLAALAMVNRGYSLLWQAIRRASPARRERAGEWVDSCLGIHGMIGGQASDLSGWRGEQSSCEVSAVAARKTGDLLRLTLVLPAMVGNGSEREIHLLDRLGLLRGLAYQAADDLKDVLLAEHESGKTGGRDADLGRPNLILAEGFQATLRRFKRLRQAGDRVQDRLPGGAVRWGMLAPLRVTLPTASCPAAIPIAV